MIGASALSPLEELAEVAKIVRSHHERFDGQGFPDGLQGTSIARGARILSIVNDYDGLQIGTLSEKRMSPDEAMSIITQSRGKRYDPAVVDAFVDMIGHLGREDMAKEQAVPYADLQNGMVLARDFVSREGLLLLAADFVLDARVIHQIREYARRENTAVMLYVKNDSNAGAKP